MTKSEEILDGFLRPVGSERLSGGGLLIPTLCMVMGTALGYEVAHGSWKTVGAVLASLLVLQWPVETAFGVFLFLVPFDSISILGGKQEGTAVTWFAAAGAAIVLAATAAAQRRLKWPPRAAMWWSLMMLWAATTYLWALDRELAAERLPTAFSLLLLLIVSMSIRITDREFACVTLLAVAGGVAAGIISVLQFFSGTTPGLRASLMMNDSATDPNQFAASLLLPLALAVGWLIFAQRWSVRLVMVGAVALVALSVFLTMSRGALVALALMTFIFLFRTRTRLIAPIVVLALALMFMPEEFFHRFQTAAETGGAGRIDIWTAGVAALKHYGIFGSGLSSFPFAYNEFAGRASRYRGLARDPHNIYLGVWVEFGIVGLFFMFLAVKSHMNSFPRLRSNLRGVLLGQTIALEAACWSMLGASFFLSTLWRKAFWVPWMLAAMAAGLERSHGSAVFQDNFATDTRETLSDGTIHE
jgi:O-antigen ligase